MKSLYIFASLLLFLISCREEEIPLQVLPPVPGGDWKIYQLAKIHAPDIPVDDRSFSGTIGNFNVSLGRIPGDTLIFIIPNVGKGQTQLKVNMGKQIRTWDLELDFFPYYDDQKTFFDLFSEKTEVLQERIQNVEKLKELAIPFKAWIEFFKQKKAALTATENDWLSGIMQYDRSFMPRPTDTFELECINGPASTLGSMTYRFVAFDHSHFNDFTLLPSNALYDAVLAGFGLSFWYQKILLEYYAHLTLECPQIRGFELKYPETGEVISNEETLKLESHVSATFSHNGIFKALTIEDMREDGPHFLDGIGFRDKEKISLFLSEMVEKYVKAYQWDLPLLTPSSLILPPADAPTTKGPIQKLEWYYYSLFDNPKIRLVDFKSNEETFTVKLESLDGNPQPFNLEIFIRTNSMGFEAVIPALLEVTCPILVDVILKEKTHHINIEFGQAPYEITWSNGVTANFSQNLAPGNYNVKVKDANGCERIVEFPAPEYGTVEDIDGNVYETVKIGNTWWMSENLRTTRKRDGSPIQLLESNEAWTTTLSPGYSWKNNDEATDDSYGKLYNYYAACCEICPEGWELPGSFEFSQLAQVFGLRYARHLRNVNAWREESFKSTNLTGLKILPSGARSGTNGDFGYLDWELASIWTSYKDAFGYPYISLVLGSSDHPSLGISLNARDGHSIRCVKKN